jgi:phospholipid/cholesterol/gamma-HCH transport system substrate-binding protein
MAITDSLSRSVRTGIFVVLGVFVFFAALFILGARQQLFADRVNIYSLYKDVAGLQEGAFVRIAGINVGSVSKIELPDSLGNVRTEFNIRTDAIDQIRTDSRAIIGTEGLIGARIIMITQGSRAAEQIAAGDTITGQSPMALYEYQDTIDEAIENLPEMMLNVGMTLASLRSIMDKIDGGKGSIGKLISTDALHDSLMAITGNVRDVTETADRALRAIQVEATVLSQEYGAVAESLALALGDIRGTATSVTRLVQTLQDGEGTIGKLLTDDSLYVVMTSTVASGDTMIKKVAAAIDEISDAAFNIAGAAQQAGTTIDVIARNVTEGRGTIGKLVQGDSVYVRLNRTLLNLQIASEKLAVNMEAVRSNWLFRGYFDDQGYWDEIDRKIELQEQRTIRLRDWEERLLRLQEDLLELEERIEESDGAILQPVRSEVDPASVREPRPGR